MNLEKISKKVTLEMLYNGLCFDKKYTVEFCVDYDGPNCPRVCEYYQKNKLEEYNVD